VFGVGAVAGEVADGGVAVVESGAKLGLIPQPPNIPGAYTFYGSGHGRMEKPALALQISRPSSRVSGSRTHPLPTIRPQFEGGYAITRPMGNDNFENGIGSALYSIGFSGTAMASHPGDTVGSPAFYWDNGFPEGGVTGSKLSAGNLVDLTNPVIIYPSAGIPPTQMNWSLQVQQEFPGKIIGPIGYVGSHSYHIGVWSKPNQINPAVAAKYAGAAAKVGIPLNERSTSQSTVRQLLRAGCRCHFRASQRQSAQPVPPSVRRFARSRSMAASTIPLIR